MHLPLMSHCDPLVYYLLSQQENKLNHRKPVGSVNVRVYERDDCKDTGFILLHVCVLEKEEN